MESLSNSPLLLGLKGPPSPLGSHRVIRQESYNALKEIHTGELFVEKVTRRWSVDENGNVKRLLSDETERWSCEEWKQTATPEHIEALENLLRDEGRLKQTVKDKTARWVHINTRHLHTVYCSRCDAPHCLCDDGKGAPREQHPHHGWTDDMVKRCCLPTDPDYVEASGPVMRSRQDSGTPELSLPDFSYGLPAFDLTGDDSDGVKLTQ